MDVKAQPTRSYEDFQPSSCWLRAEGQDTVVLSLAGFKKHHLRIQMGKEGYLKISGDRPLEGNRWSRFQKEFHIPKIFDTDKVHAKLLGELLYVIIPKKMSQPTLKDPAAPTLQSPENKENESKTKSEKNQGETNGATVHGSPQSQSQSQSQTEPETGTETSTETVTETETETETEMENHKDSPIAGDGTKDKMHSVTEANLETNETCSKRKQAGGFKFGVGASVSRLSKRSRVVIVYGAVAIVMVFLGMYATYKLIRSVEEIENFEN